MLEIAFGQRRARDGNVVLAQPTSLDPTSVAYARGSADAAAVKLRYHPYYNPRPVTREGVRALLDDAFHGRRP
jgi:maleylacetate reductase